MGLRAEQAHGAETNDGDGDEGKDHCCNDVTVHGRSFQVGGMNAFLHYITTKAKKQQCTLRQLWLPPLLFHSMSVVIIDTRTCACYHGICVF